MGSGGSISPRPEATDRVAPVLAADDSVDPCESIPTSPTEGLAVRPTSSGSGLRRADQVVMDARAEVPENLVDLVLKKGTELERKKGTELERRSSKKVSNLREYFLHDYKYGGMFQHDGYRASNSWCFEDKKFGIRVWRDAIDLTEGAAGEVDCVFHYTSELGFRNITHTELQTAEIFASLVTAGKQANAWWGRGVYTVRKAPDEWPDIETLMDNNFRNMLRRDVEKLGQEAALQQYKGRVAYCIPILANSSILYDVSLRQTPEMVEHHKPPGTNLMGKCLDGRECIVVRVEQDDEVRNASAVLTATLKMRSSMAATNFGLTSEEALSADQRLGGVLFARGLYGEAEAVLTRLVSTCMTSLGPNDMMTLQSMHSMASLQWRQGKFLEAEELQRKVVESKTATLGQKHGDTLLSMKTLADILKDLGNFSEAERLHRQALEALEATVGLEHPETLSSVSSLAKVLRRLGNFPEALSLDRRVLEVREASLGPHHPDTLRAVNNLAGVLDKLSHSDNDFIQEVESLLRRAHEGYKDTLGHSHPNTLRSVMNLATVLCKLDNLTEAEKLSREALDTQVSTLGPRHPDTLMSANNLATILCKRRNFSEAESLRRGALLTQEATLGPKHPDTLKSMFLLGGLLFDQGKSSESESYLRRAAEISEATLGRDHPDALKYADALHKVGGK